MAGGARSAGPYPSGSDSGYRIARLESEIEARRREISQLKAAARIEEIISENNDERDSVDCMSDSLGFSPVEGESLDELMALWERRLSENDDDGVEGVVMDTGGDLTATKSDPARRYSHGPAADGAFSSSSPPATIIWASCQNDESVGSVSGDGASPRPQGANALLERLTISSLGGRSRRRAAAALKSQDLEKMLRERNARIEDLEAIVRSNVEIIERMVGVMVRRRAFRGEDCADAAEKKFVGLKEDLLSKIDKGCLALSPAEDDPRKAAKSYVKCDCESLSQLVSSLQVTVEDLESTASLQGKQNDTLKNEVLRLQKVIHSMELCASSQEDEVESLRAEIIKLRLRSKIQDEKRRAVEKALSGSSSQEDQIEALRAEIMKLRAQSDMREEEKRRTLENERTKLELNCLECSVHDALRGT